MKAQFDNLVMSSLLLYVDNKISTEGEAFTNHGSRLYPVASNISGIYTYAAPFKQLVGDVSVSGSTVMSGVYINNNFITSGTSGFLGINHAEGQVYFNTNVNSSNLSGNYSVKDFNVYLTSKPEEELIFETKFEVKPKTSQLVTGLASNKETYPAVFIKNNGGINSPFAIGGEDLTLINARLIILANNSYNLDAVCSILKDAARDYVPIINQNELPFNHFGLTKSGYNYSVMKSGKIPQGNALYINRAFVNKNITRDSYNVQNPDVHFAFVDFELETPRFPRL